MKLPGRKDIPDGDKPSWLTHSYTTEARRYYFKERKQALELLINACQATQDPAVVRFYEKYKAADHVVALLTEHEKRRDE